MMDALEFLGIIAALATVLVWYVRNEEAGENGARGLLALRDPRAGPSTRKRAYRMKARAAQSRRLRLDVDQTPNPQSTYRSTEEGARMRRRFRRQDQARYRVKDKAAPYQTDDNTGAA